MRSIDFSFHLNHFLFRSRASELLSRSRLARGCVFALCFTQPYLIADNISQKFLVSKVGGQTDLSSVSMQK